MAWAEDRAPWRHDPSADPGAKTEGGRQDAALSFPFGIGIKAPKRHYLFERTVHLVSRPRSLHFTLNHYRVEGHPRSGDSRDYTEEKALKGRLIIGTGAIAPGPTGETLTLVGRLRSRAAGDKGSSA